MLLDLTTSVGSDFIKNFPAQNEVNLDKIDAYARACLITHPLKSYQPIFKASTDSPVIGTGGPAVLRGYYYEIFDQIFTWGEFRFGTSSSNAGNGSWYMSMPFPIFNVIGITSTFNNTPVIGTGSIWDNDTASTRQPVNLLAVDSNYVQFAPRLNSGATFREVRDNFPITWAAQDGMCWNAHYQRAPS
jgi:hypothetical protein